MIYQRHYRGVAELLAAAPSPANRGAGLAHWNKLNRLSAWYGCESKEEAHSLLLGGWDEGVRRARAAVGRLELPQVASIRRRPVWRDTGDELSLDRLYSGDADQAWRSTERRTCPPGLVPTSRVLVCLNASGFRRPEEFFWRGAVAVMLSDALEESGRSCEVVAYSYVSHLLASNMNSREPDSFISVVLKRADEPLHLPRLAAMTAHPAALRVAMFRAYWAVPDKVNSSLGGPREDLDPPRAPGDDGIRVVVRNCFSEGGARDLLANWNKGWIE